MGKGYFNQPSLKVNNGSIVIYYHFENTCRFSTGISISNITDSKGKFKDWDYKHNKLKSSVEDFESKNQLLREKIDSVTNILQEKYKDEETILTGKELQELLKNDYKVSNTIKTKLIFDHYQKFLKHKTEVFKKKPQSLKDYNSLNSHLEGYEILKNKKIKFKDFNKFFLEDFISFMRSKHPKEIKLPNGDIFKFKSEGNLVEETLRKRLDCLNEFNNFLVSEKLLPENDFIKKRRSEIKLGTKKKVTLTIDEIHKLYDFNFSDPNLNKTKDLFVFICFMGLRWSDIELFDSGFIRKNGEEWFYEFTPIKTEDSSSIDCYIPMCNVVKEIIIKYDYDLKSIITNNSDFNEKLKLMGKECGLFNEITRTKDKETGVYLKRWELITAHKGRDTFITNLIDTTPVNELMKYTGHTKVSTLMSYVDKSRQVSSKYIKIFDK